MYSRHTHAFVSRLVFKAKMQQWVLIHVTPAEWRQVPLATVLPALVRAWGRILPPKGALVSVTKLFMHGHVMAA